ncbi:dsRBD fold-containing protein [Streptomyces sp. NPDC059176]|uniref:dsRBD fold-containing protein n=1 Tax=unclassified Streptomyces TaxID=2593676 RepID=UPI0036C2244E
MARTLEWRVRMRLSEDEGTTRARVDLDTGTTTLTGHGTARCNPADVDVPEIGDELAASRAMGDLARQLMRVADRDLEAVGAGPAKAEPDPGYGWPGAG